jgi:hypothetical protein
VSWLSSADADDELVAVSIGVDRHGALRRPSTNWHSPEPRGLVGASTSRTHVVVLVMRSWKGEQTLVTGMMSRTLTVLSTRVMAYATLVR